MEIRLTASNMCSLRIHIRRRRRSGPKLFGKNLDVQVSRAPWPSGFTNPIWSRRYSRAAASCPDGKQPQMHPIMIPKSWPVHVCRLRSRVLNFWAASTRASQRIFPQKLSNWVFNDRRCEFRGLGQCEDLGCPAEMARKTFAKKKIPAPAARIRF